MSLIPILVDVQRDVFARDIYGGEVATPGSVYTGLSATFNYYQASSQRAERNRFESISQIRGPGVLTRTVGVVIFDPAPSGVTIQVNDRIVANPAVAGVPTLSVIAVRTYEVTLQLDVEAVT